jgi:prepilin-type processing-associated H-X9-DG protein
MKTTRIHTNNGLTLIELVILIGLLAILAAMLLPALDHRPAYAPRISCINNLRQVGLAFRTWALDNNGKYPQQASVTNGGIMELVESGQAWVHFLVMSNELSTPKILFCPAESGSTKKCATTFTSFPSGALGQIRFASDKNLSYFVGVDAQDTNPQKILSGDRGLAIDGVPAKPGLLMVRSNSIVTWFKPRHDDGNVGFADGSVQSVSASMLTGVFRAGGVATNRLAMP